jgi:hypothetical protein
MPNVIGTFGRACPPDVVREPVLVFAFAVICRVTP